MNLHPIKCWAEDERPREKLIQKGRSSLSDAELLAILIGSGSSRQSAVELSRTILHSYKNSLSALSKGSLHNLMEFNGIGEAKAVSIIAAMELARRRQSERSEDRIKIKCSSDAYHLLSRHLRELDHEEFYILMLNRANEVLRTEQISKGGVSGTVADGKIIFQKALMTGCSAIILAHNHPSGQLKPSEADKRLTRNMKQFGEMIDLQILDHLIITDNNYFSFADEGIL